MEKSIGFTEEHLAPSPRTTVSLPFSCLPSGPLKCSHNSSISCFASTCSLGLTLHFAPRHPRRCLGLIIAVAARNDNLDRSASTTSSAIFVFREESRVERASSRENTLLDVIFITHTFANWIPVSMKNLRDFCQKVGKNARA